MPNNSLDLQSQNVWCFVKMWGSVNNKVHNKTYYIQKTSLEVFQDHHQDSTLTNGDHLKCNWAKRDNRESETTNKPISHL